MVRALGIDPGTMSFDLVMVEEERVVWEKNISTIDIARSPSVLVDAIVEAGEPDIVAGPSGYGTPIVCNRDIVDPYTFALEVLLLTSPEDIEAGMERGEVGIAVYKALADVVVELWRRGLNVCYIPSVILLPTVPRHRKLNRVDMGTADKMAIAVLGVYDQSRRLGVDYSDVSFILVEMGYGYNAVIGVEEGRIVDGYGGTLTPMGFLTIGAIDGEVVVAGRTWSRSDVFYGGVSTICGEYDVVKALEKRERDELCMDAFKQMFENVEKHVAMVNRAVRKPREIIVSGRLTRIKEVWNELERRLSGIAPVTRLRGLEGARIAKEAAQGYAVIGEGIGGGVFKKLIVHMNILGARGTVFDYLYHPRLAKARERLRRAFKRSVSPNAADKLLSFIQETS